VIYRSIFRLASVAILSVTATYALAGDFFEEKGAALDSYDALSYFAPAPDPILGVKELSFDYKGSKFYFITNTHLHTFAADPERYAPQYGGFDAFGRIARPQGWRAPACVCLGRWKALHVQ